MSTPGFKIILPGVKKLAPGAGKVYAWRTVVIGAAPVRKQQLPPNEVRRPVPGFLPHFAENPLIKLPVPTVPRLFNGGAARLLGNRMRPQLQLSEGHTSPSFELFLCRKTPL